MLTQWNESSHLDFKSMPVFPILRITHDILTQVKYNIGPVIKATQDTSGPVHNA
jgi:hypothetical protein